MDAVAILRTTRRHRDSNGRGRLLATARGPKVSATSRLQLRVWSDDDDDDDDRGGTLVLDIEPKIVPAGSSKLSLAGPARRTELKILRIVSSLGLRGILRTSVTCKRLHLHLIYDAAVWKNLAVKYHLLEDTPKALFALEKTKRKTRRRNIRYGTKGLHGAVIIGAPINFPVQNLFRFMQILGLSYYSHYLQYSYIASLLYWYLYKFGHEDADLICLKMTASSSETAISCIQVGMLGSLMVGWNSMRGLGSQLTVTSSTTDSSIGGTQQGTSPGQLPQFCP
ncbi:hypothetical protein Pelo_11445 [Pelomyxa schiedti]|nr:hypothetical protein Pelo_11445 [Pelomyxa schiedti]